MECLRSYLFFAFQIVRKFFFGFQMHTKIRKQIYVNAAKVKYATS